MIDASAAVRLDFERVARLLMISNRELRKYQNLLKNRKSYAARTRLNTRVRLARDQCLPTWDLLTGSLGKAMI